MPVIEGQTVWTMRTSNFYHGPSTTEDENLDADIGVFFYRNFLCWIQRQLNWQLLCSIFVPADHAFALDPMLPVSTSFDGCHIFIQVDSPGEPHIVPRAGIWVSFELKNHRSIQVLESLVSRIQLSKVFTRAVKPLMDLVDILSNYGLVTWSLGETMYLAGVEDPEILQYASSEMAQVCSRHHRHVAAITLY